MGKRLRLHAARAARTRPVSESAVPSCGPFRVRRRSLPARVAFVPRAVGLALPLASARRAAGADPSLPPSESRVGATESGAARTPGPDASLAHSLATGCQPRPVPIRRVGARPLRAPASEAAPRPGALSTGNRWWCGGHGETERGQRRSCSPLPPPGHFIDRPPQPTYQSARKECEITSLAALAPQGRPSPAAPPPTYQAASSEPINRFHW